MRLEQTVTVTAPGRCGVLGNPTDMYGGSVISCATRERARCVITPADTLTVEATGYERQTITTGDDLDPRGDYLDLAKAVLRHFAIDPLEDRFHLTTNTELPMQAGLSGSTALVAAVYAAVNQWLQYAPLPSHRLAEEIRRVEYEEMGVVCGFQDQHMAVWGGLNYMDFRDKGSHLAPHEQPYATVEPLAPILFPDPNAEPLPLLLAHTGVKHLSGQVHRPLRQRWLDGEPAVVNGYTRIGQLARTHKAALLARDWDTLAVAMNENQQIQHDLGASGAACDYLVAVALANGALAAKLAGAGHGGTVIVLTQEPERTGKALRDAGAGRLLTPDPHALGLQITAT